MLKRYLGIMLAVLMFLSILPALALADWWEPYPEPVVIHIAAEENTNAVFADGEDYETNLWTKKFKELFNVDVVLDMSANNTNREYDQKINLAIASQTIPDSFPCNRIQFAQLKAADMLEDLTTAYEEFASPSLRKMMDKYPEIVATAKNDRGELVALPRFFYGYETLTRFLWIRNDWVEENGITQPESIEDLEAIMQTFIDNDGAKYGVILDKELWAMFRMASAFHAYPRRSWVEGPDGTIVYGATLPETKNMLEYFAKWYREGLIRTDFATLTEEASRQDAYNGLVGMATGENWAGWLFGNDMVRTQGDGTYFVSFELPSIDGGKVMHPVEFPNEIYNVVRKGYGNPEVLIKLVNYYIDVLDDALGAGTMTLEEVLPFNTNDMHHVTGPFKVEFDHYKDVSEVSYAVDHDGGPLTSGNAILFYNEIRKWLDEGDLVGMGRWLQQGGQEFGSIPKAIGHVDNGQILFSELWGLPPDVLVDYGTTLEDLLIEGFTEIIMGVESIDYFETLIENWYAAGGQECTDAVNEMYGGK
ncbi:MAG: extracellular solute-binding protein [Clostridia bacterium]|nr:extracellular solute-binding protein [Clostridia bacterium]